MIECAIVGAGYCGPMPSAMHLLELASEPLVVRVLLGEQSTVEVLVNLASKGQVNLTISPSKAEVLRHRDSMESCHY